MKRVLVNLLALLSLLLSLALLALWVRSYFVSDHVRTFYVPHPHRHGVAYLASFNRGMARIARLDVRYEGAWRGPGDMSTFVQRGPAWYGTRPHHARPAAERFLIAFRYNDRSSPTPLPGLTERVRTLSMPLWPGAALFGMLPALRGWRRLRRLRARRRSRRGLCARCGYDLRESPEQCPECGAVAAMAGKINSPV